MKTDAQLFKALSHPLRLELLDQIGSCGELSVTDMDSSDKASQSCVSQHLAVLRKANLVSTRKESQRVYYSLNSDTFIEAKRTLEGLENTA